MATHQSALKRIRQNKRRNARNRHYRSMLRSGTKKILSAETPASATEQLRVISSLLDKLAQKRIIHRNKAANNKSRLARFVNKLEKTAPAAA